MLRLDFNLDFESGLYYGVGCVLVGFGKGTGNLGLDWIH